MRKLSVVAVVMGLMACPPPKTDTCGGQVCTETQYCDQGALLCREDQRPRTVVDPTEPISTASFVVTGKIVDDVNVTRAEWFVGSDAPEPLLLDNEGRFSVEIGVPELDSAPLTFSVRAFDKIGSSLESASLEVDNLGPAIDVLWPVADSAVPGRELEVVLIATDGSGRLSALKIGNQTVGEPVSGAETSQTVQLPADTDLANVSIVAEAIDRYGNKSAREIIALVDNASPRVEIHRPFPDEIIQSEFLSAAATISDGSPVSVIFEFAGREPVVATNSNSTEWTAILPVPPIDGTSTFRVVATDASGNQTIAPLLVTVDRVGPQVTIHSPTNNSVHRTDVLVSVTAPGAVSSAASFDNGSSWIPLIFSDGAWSLGIPPPAGDLTARSILVRALDGNGNVGYGQVFIRTDTVAPQLDIWTPTPNQKFRAADFVSTERVVLSWGVSDGDPTLTTTIDGVPHNSNFADVTTSPADNPTMYTRTVVVRDTAGNSTTAVLEFSVDRVPPSVASWLPANSVRNISGNSVIAFSEPVFGANAIDAPFTATGVAVTAGSWNPSHTEFTLPLSGALNKVVNASLSSVTDAHGNPLVASASRRFHVATALDGGTLFNGVASFAAASDADGVLTTYIVQPSGCTGTCLNVGVGRLFRDNGGSLSPVVTSFSSAASTGWLNVWNTVNATSLESTPHYGLLINRSFEGPIQAWPGGSAMLPSGASGAVVSSPAMYRESNFSPYAIVTGAAYRRGVYEVTLPISPTGIVSSSSQHVSMFSPEASALRFTRLWCGARSTGGDTCGAAEYAVSVSEAAYDITVASTLSGSCEVIAFSSSGARRYAFLAKPAYENPAQVVTVPMLQTLSSVPAPATAVRSRFARFNGNGADSLIYTDADTLGGVLRVKRLLGCAISASDPVLLTASLTNVHERANPIQVGQKIGLIWQDGSDVKLWVQP